MTIDDALTDHVAAVSGLVQGSGHVLLNISERIAACSLAAEAPHLRQRRQRRRRAAFRGRVCQSNAHDRRALPAIALSTDTSSLTAIANDASYDGSSPVRSRRSDAPATCSSGSRRVADPQTCWPPWQPPAKSG